MLCSSAASHGVLHVYGNSVSVDGLYKPWEIFIRVSFITPSCSTSPVPQAVNSAKAPVDRITRLSRTLRCVFESHRSLIICAPRLLSTKLPNHAAHPRKLIVRNTIHQNVTWQRQSPSQSPTRVFPVT